MHPRNRLFIALALVYGLAGGLLALARLAAPQLVPGDVTRAHAHLMLLGLVLMTIYGVALHVLPRFGGYRLRSELLAWAQFWLANAGLPCMVAGWLATLRWLVVLGGALSVAAMLAFAVNVVFTVRLAPPAVGR
ncbi:MAG TPA: cbb3-type cytochrome c oxidase subunit I [Burkholderiales bacterium]|nr:cbb3-type cytochrome c oxidase subunit I [Burkholderiales bacterium]